MEKIFLLFRYKTEQFAYVTTPDAVLPSNNFLIPDFPLLPITINLICSFSACCSISS